MRVIIFWLLASVSAEISSQQTIYIGGIFDTDDVSLKSAFEAEISRINNRSLLITNNTIVAVVENVKEFNSFEASEAVCRLLEHGIVAVFGPQSPNSWAHVQSVCHDFNMVHLNTRWDYSWKYKGGTFINVFPHGPTLSKAYAYLVKLWKWKSFAIVYQNETALVRLKEVFKSEGRIPLGFMLVQMSSDGEHHADLKRIKNAGIFNIIVDGDLETTFRVLLQAQQISMMTNKQHFFITNLDFHLVNTKPFSYSEAVITSLRLVNPNQVHAEEIATLIQHEPRNIVELINPKALKTESALIIDALNILLSGLSMMKVSSYDVKPLHCESSGVWERGAGLFNLMNMIQLNDGLSGKVKLTAGFRKEFDVDIMEILGNEMQKIGVLSSISENTKLIGLHINTTKSNTSITTGVLKNKHLKITTILSVPFVMLKTSKNWTGNDRYEGFCAELLQILAKELGFTYTLYEVPDKSYGRLNEETQTWDGTIGEIQSNKADLAVGDLTITSQRHEYVDFSSAFMHLGISLLYLKPEKAAPGFMFFLQPFSAVVWVLIGLMIIVVGAGFFFVGRISPYEWHNPNPCNRNPEELHSNFSFLNSLWYAFVYLMQQGSNITLRSISTRSIATFWWFFTLIMVATYTAKLFSNFSIENLEVPFKDIHQLEAQNHIKYGCIGTGSTRAFFKSNQFAIFQRMYYAMENENPSVYTKTHEEGLERVRQGNFAYFIESPSIEYITQRNCDLTQIGGQLNARGYGIAMPKNSQYKEIINQAILHLQEHGDLLKLRLKWWKLKNDGGQCSDGGKVYVSPLSASSFGGLLSVLIAGIILAILISGIEFWLKVRQMARYLKKPMCTAILDELGMLVRCRKSRDAVRSLNEEQVSVHSINDDPIE